MKSRNIFGMDTQKSNAVYLILIHYDVYCEKAVRIS